MMCTSFAKLCSFGFARQVFVFGCVGFAAFLTHWLVVALLVPLSIPPLLANPFGFLSAFFVSYFGHHRWTFSVSKFSSATEECGDSSAPSRHPNSLYKTSMVRYFFVAFTSFLLNECIYFLLLRYTHLGYRLSLFIVLLVIPPYTFVLSKLWAFRGKGT